MREATWRTVGGIAGIVFAILVVLPFIVVGGGPEFAGEPGVIAQFFVDKEGQIFLGSVSLMLAAFALAWFVGGLRDALERDVDAGSRTALGAATIGGVIAAASYAIAGAVLVVGAARVGEHGTDGAASSFINWDLFMVIYGGAAPIGLAALLSGVGVLALRAGVFLPAWLGWVSLVLAVIGLIPPIAFVLSIGFALWSIVVAIFMLRSRATGADAS